MKYRGGSIMELACFAAAEPEQLRIQFLLYGMIFSQLYSSVWC